VKGGNLDEKSSSDCIFIILAAGFCLARRPRPCQVEGGLVQGAVEERLTVYRGIPYARAAGRRTSGLAALLSRW